ncbi:Mg2+ and Co2+ transporter [Lentilactobacillus fungorum]|uniref:Mg2+ and Co2+ transporter n=2 Tax=Lentilactobacillus fungorum TaxID=2201250 RepID=A0ABQ3VYP0_9LACO|nr:Mg2+ and Co2+ transporter [Lentilactobacillus fungorum]
MGDIDMIRPEKTIGKTKWIETIKLTPAEQARLQDDYGIDEDIIEYVTDRDESANYVYDVNEDDQLFILLGPYALNKNDIRYITQPFGILLHQGILFTFNQGHIAEVNDAFQSAFENPEVDTVDAFILEALFTVVDSYIPIARAVTRKRNQLDKMLNRKTKNVDLIALSHLQQTLTFLTSAVQLNLSLLRRMPSTHFGKGADQEKQDLFEDVTIEAEQVQRMIEIETQVVDRIDHTFNSIANNSLNDTMKFLTIWSLTMAVPTIITGFYGMNVKLPLATLKYAWIIAIAISVFLIVWLLVLLKARHKM